MDRGVPRPAAKGFSLPPEQNPEQTPQGDQRHVGQNGRDVSVGQNPRRDELSKAVTPEVLVDGDGNKDGSGHRFVRINGVCGRNGWEGSHLDASAGEADDDDDLKSQYIIRVLGRIRQTFQSQ